MKTKIFLIGILLVIFISGCDNNKLENYECSEGERIGENCYLEPLTKTLQGIITISAYEMTNLIDEVYERNEITILTPSRCLIAELELINVTSFEINDTLIEYYFDEYMFVLVNDENKSKSVFINTTYTYRWRKPIWLKEGSYCKGEVERYGGEILK